MSGYSIRLTDRASDGAALLTSLMDEARRRGHARVRLNAQARARAVLCAPRLFAPEGAPFAEAGIAHQAMARALATTKR